MPVTVAKFFSVIIADMQDGLATVSLKAFISVYNQLPRVVSNISKESAGA